MRFDKMTYRRFPYEEAEARYQRLFQKMETLAGEQDCRALLQEYDRLLADMTPMDLCYIRHDMDVNDPFYAAEQEYYDAAGPKLAALSSRFNRLLLASPYRGCFEAIMGPFAMSILQAGLEEENDAAIALAQEENALTARYSLLTSNATVDYQGAQVSRGSMAAELQSPDRETRRLAAEAVAASWEAQRPELEQLFDQLVHNRDGQARALGCRDYVQLGYRRMCRIGYTPEDVRRFREQVKQELVPLAGRVHQARKKRLGLDHLYGYDGSVSFLQGNPVPLGDTAFCLEMTRRMYHALSPETAEYIDFVLDNGLYDVEMRPGKRGGGYCMKLEAYQAPFIFANFDGTSENAYIMSHEGGHGFYFYRKRGEAVPQRGWYTSEMAETHAMAMEFFTGPHMELFFGPRAGDYRQSHLEQALTRILYQCQQDEFQHLVYEHPALTAAQRNEAWETLEQAYFPYREYTDAERRRVGSRWQRIPHLYYWPFYAIDYALAQVCALQYAQWMQTDFAAAWQSYLAFCDASGSENFPQALRTAGLRSPFEAGGLRQMAAWLQTRLDI